MKRHRLAAAGANLDPRKTFPGLSGYGGLRSLSKGMFESAEPSYDETYALEEQKILTMNNDVIRLIENLENSELK